MTSGRLPHGAKQGMLSLASTIAWLAEQLNSASSAYQVLLELEARLEYKQHLLDTSGFAETGEAKALNVQAFIDYAEGKDSTTAFLAHVEKISFSAAGKNPDDKQARVVITSVFRAKGLQWPRVIIPAVNYGHYPAAGTNTDLSEERRLFYVALTRTQAELNLHVLSGRPPSIFMEGLHELLLDTRRAGASLSVDLNAWDAADAINVMKVYRYLERYLLVWYDHDEHLASWLVAADTAWRSVSEGLIPHAMLTKLNQQVDQVKVEACLARLRGSATKRRQVPALPRPTTKPSYKPYTIERGELPKGTRVRHAIHGEGSVLRFGVEMSLSFVEVAFDKGRTVRLVLPAAAFDVIY
jgi:ATP-dependent exoDNAse (exonuclease V) beta subunit